MNPATAEILPSTLVRRAAVPRSRIGLLILVCGIAGLGAAGAASATSSEGDVPATIVHYDPHSLDTDQGARVLYRRIVKAAVVVCPDMRVNPHFISDATRQCREQAVARAVHAINAPRLVAVYTATEKRG